MEEEDAQHAIAIHPTKLERLSLSQVNQSQYQSQEQEQYASRTEESFFFAHGAEDEVGVLFGHEF